MKVAFKSLVATAVAALCLAGGAAHADTVIAVTDFASTGNYVDPTIAPSIDNNFTLNSYNVTNSGNVNSLFNGSFLAFCVQISEELSSNIGTAPGDNTYTAGFAAVSPLVQRLFDLQYDNAKSSVASAMAFALALQELIVETSSTKSLDNGLYARESSGVLDPQSSNAIIAGNAMLAQVLAASDASVHKRIVRFDSPSSQDLMAALDAPSTNVPEPSGLALMAAALAAAAAIARRRNRG
jgi:hypothetical protein